MGKTCIITGASRGIGKEVSIRLSKTDKFDNYVLLARNLRDLEVTKSLMRKNLSITCLALDLMDLNSLEDTIANIYSKYKSIDTLINIAGFVDPKSLLETTLDNWKKTFTINVTSLFLLTKYVVKYMKSKGGKIINFASTAGMSSRPGWLAYACSKAAVISLSQTLSEELKEYKIKVYCISPGRCATDLRKILAPEEDPSTIMQPEDVAVFVENILSDYGDILDSQNIVLRKQTIP